VSRRFWSGRTEGLAPRWLALLLLACTQAPHATSESEVWLEEFSFLPPPAWNVDRQGRIVELIGPDGTNRINVMLAPAHMPLPGEEQPGEPAEVAGLPVVWRQVSAGGFEQIHVIFPAPRQDGRQLRILFQTSDPPLADHRPLFDIFLLGLESWQRPPEGWVKLPEAMVQPSIDPLEDLVSADFDRRER